MLHRQCLSGYNRYGEEILHMVYLGAPSQPKEAHSLEAEHGAGTSCEALSMGFFCFRFSILRHLLFSNILTQRILKTKIEEEFAGVAQW